MSNVSAVGGTSRHFTPEQEEALRKDEATSTIVKRDTGGKAEIHGYDLTWRETKHDQQSPLHAGKVGAKEVLHAVLEGAEISGASLGAGGPIGLALGNLALGIYALHEAHVKGEAQAVAAARDNAHVGLIGALDLPASYKAAQFDGRYKDVPRGDNSEAARIVGKLRTDTKGMTVLQMHADRGMVAARDFLASKLTPEQFFKAHPEVAKSCLQDAAFRAGFEAYLHVAHDEPAARAGLDAKLDEKNGWYTQSHIQVRA